MTIAQEEIFGPVVSVTCYSDEDDAARKANASPYGLNGAVHSADPKRGFAFAQRRAGSERADHRSQTPLGFFRQSGMGREGSKRSLEVKAMHMEG